MLSLFLILATLSEISVQKPYDESRYENNYAREGGINPPIFEMTDARDSHGVKGGDQSQVKGNYDQVYVTTKRMVTYNTKENFRHVTEFPPIRSKTKSPPTTQASFVTNIHSHNQMVTSPTSASNEQKPINININQNVVVRTGSACCLYNSIQPSKPTNCFVCKEKKKFRRGDLKKMRAARNPKCLCRRGFIAEPDEAREVPEHDLFNSVVDHLTLVDALMELQGPPKDSAPEARRGTKLCDLIENPNSVFCRLVKELYESEDRTPNKKASRTFE